MRAPAGLLAIVPCATVMVGACAPVGPDYARPPVLTPTQYRFVEGAEQGESLADAPWWQVFDDPVLQALVREAIENNLDLRSAMARLDRARAEAGVARSLLYPQIDAVAEPTARQNFGGATDDVLHGGLYGVRLSWEIDLFGKLRRGHEQAIAIMLATEQAQRGVLVTLVADVAANYFLLRELDAELAIAGETLRVNDETVTYFRNRLDGGVSNRLELDRISANRAATAAVIPDLEQQIAIVEHTLSLLLGRVPGAIAREPLSATALPPPAIPPGLPASLLERRPDVLEAEQLLVAANASVGVARALFFPTLSLTGVLGAISGDLTNILGGNGGVWEVTPGLLQPVFNAGRLRRNLDAARASVDEAVAEYRKAALNGYREVANALITIQKLADMRAQREVGVAALQDASTLARSRHTAGLASYIEILTADEELFDEQLRLAETRGAELRARADLYRAFGGGWQQP